MPNKYSKLTKRKDTEENKRFWDSVRKAKEEVEAWPSWKKELVRDLCPNLMISYQKKIREQEGRKLVIEF